MFERPHHRRIATVLEALDAEVLAANDCLFGGGTAMALRYVEYRESVDIDFLVSKVDGYRQLRQRLTGPGGMRAITRPDHALSQAREVRADPYGVRTLLQVDGSNIKFEIVLEGSDRAGSTWSGGPGISPRFDSFERHGCLCPLWVMGPFAHCRHSRNSSYSTVRSFVSECEWLVQKHRHLH